MLRSKLIPLVLLVMVLSVFAGTILAKGDTPGPVDPTQVKETAVQSVLDGEGKVIDPNSRMASAARDHEGGFGGWYFSEDKDTVYVYMQDTTKTAEAQDAFDSAYPGQHTPANVVVVAGDYSLDDLATWLDQIIHGLASEEIRIRSFGISQGENVIQISIIGEAGVREAQRIRDELDIPEGAVEFSVSGGGGLLGGDSLEAEWRPVVGGIQHQLVVAKTGI